MSSIAILIVDIPAICTFTPDLEISDSIVTDCGRVSDSIVDLHIGNMQYHTGGPSKRKLG